MSISLYQISAQYQQVFDSIEIDEETGEVLGFDAVEKAEWAFNDKAINCGLYRKSLTAEATALKAEEDALRKRRQAVEKKAERFTEYILECMQLAGVDKVSDPRVELKVWNPAPSVVVDNLDELPEEFIRTKIERSADKTAIKKAIQNKQYLVGARLVHKKGLKIK